MINMTGTDITIPKIRTVATKTDGWIKLRYTPREPKYETRTGITERK